MEAGRFVSFYTEVEVIATFTELRKERTFLQVSVFEKCVFFFGRIFNFIWPTFNHHVHISLFRSIGYLNFPPAIAFLRVTRHILILWSSTFSLPDRPKTQLHGRRDFLKTWELLTFLTHYMGQVFCYWLGFFSRNFSLACTRKGDIPSRPSWSPDCF